jgi:peptidyl-dipeptidase Dcp
VELPSQLLENWLLEPEFLRRYPRHVDTGKPLPEEMIDKIQQSRTFMKGYQSARQLAFGKLDMAWHTTPPDQLGGDLLAFEDQAIAEVRLFPREPGIGFSPSFQHIFSGGYAAGYYSYKWAEALEADVFETFKENGLFDEDTAHHLETTILSRGGTEPPEDLFRKFKGRDPDPDALLRRDGLLA